jgi:NAD(P)-dependent dehydrogenase (short-subunit alcohol dehydrogenase family)
MDPKGRIAVVTGAAGGIGGALARALVRSGASGVVAADLDAGGLETLAAEVNGDTATAAGGGRVFPRRLDVADEAATNALVTEIEDTLGPIDLWFANAGIAHGGSYEAPDAVWQRQWQVNLMAHVYAARALVPGWIARGEGHLVTTASMAGYLTSLGDAVYAASKHAAVGFAEWLAITYGGKGVRVSCVCPGVVDTNMSRGGPDGDAAIASAAIGGGDVLAPADAAVRILDGVRADRFLILTHPEMQQYMVNKASDGDRWIRGMGRLWARSQELLGP